MSAQYIRIRMFWKFLLGCLALAGILIAGGAYLAKEGSKFKDRKNYLKKHYDRYVQYQAGLGAAVSSVADVIADDPMLRHGLAADGALTPNVGPVEAPAAVADRLFKKVSAKNSIGADLFVVFTAGGSLVYANPDAPIAAEDLRELEPIARIRSGNAFFNKVLIHDGRAIQVAGVPIHAPGSDRTVGGLLIGVELQRYLQQFKEQSDDREKMQYRLSLVHDNEVVTSVMPKENWAELAEALKPENRKLGVVGHDSREIIRLQQGDFDFTVRDVEGFVGLQSGKVGQLYLLRSRSNLEGEQATLPWLQIVIGSLLSILVAGLLALWIRHPIKKFVIASEQMLQGETNLNERIEISSRDETRDLAENINRVFGRLYTLASDVQHAAFQVGASSSEISAASKQMLEGLRDQTFKIEGSTAAVTELSASIQQVASNAVEATKVAEKSNIAVSAAVSRMQDIRTSVEDAADKIHELGESGKRIGNIVEVIRQISEQTSLLALNASIEAAHAGEQGRGFAVVADEVSSLARRVGQSAKDIEDLIQTIKEQTSEAVASMQIGTREVESGTELVTTTLQDLKQLISVVKDTAVAVQEQAVVSDEIARSMDAVQTIASEMVSGSEEAVVQGEQLHELAFALEQSVGGFNLDATDAPTARPAAGARPALRGKNPRDRG